MAYNERGFSLLEVIIVLGITLTILSIGTTIKVSIIDDYRTEQFLKVLQQDVLYMQQLTIVTNRNYHLTIEPDQHFYQIKQGGFGKVIVRREIPKHWTIKLNTLRMPIDFTVDGTIKQPGMFTIYTSNKSYNVYFPFGTGRSYFIEKE